MGAIMQPVERRLGKSGLDIRHISPLGGSTLMTSAPKSDRIAAALGPAMKLAKSTTFNPEKILPVVFSTGLFIVFDFKLAGPLPLSGNALSFV